MKKIAVIDYAMGNLNSVANAIRFLGYHPVITDQNKEIFECNAIILPGVGAFGQAMENLKERKLDQSLTEAVLKGKVPFLGICLGMQLIFEQTEEKGSFRGLSWLPGTIEKFRQGTGVRVPHVGWNNISNSDQLLLFANIVTSADYYFDHSYALYQSTQTRNVFCHYGEDFIAAVRHENIFATQFHPEKSQNNGLRVLRNFLNYMEAKSGSSC